jgi:hypothetical protein
VADDGSQQRKPTFRTAVEDVRALATIFAMEAESVLGRKTARVLGVLVLFTLVVSVLLTLLEGYIPPSGADQRKLVLGATEIVSLLGIAGTLLGTLAGSGLQFWIERRRWRREDQTRFRNELSQNCVDLYYNATLAISVAENPEQHSDLLGPKEEHLIAVMLAFSRIELLGSASLDRAASEFTDVVLRVAEQGQFDDETRRTHRQALRSFREATRQELGLNLER